MPSKDYDESEEALLKEEVDPRRSIDEGSEDESAALVGREQKGTTARAYEKKSPGFFTLRWPGRRGICVCLLLFLGIIGAIAASGFYVYQIDPPYGQSPPCRVTRYAMSVLANMGGSLSDALGRHRQVMG